MRAMMSDACDGIEYRRYAEDATMALDEAGRILAVAEPVDQGVMSYQTSHAWQCWNVRSETGFAVAESLAAFLSAPDPAAYLADLQHPPYDPEPDHSIVDPSACACGDGFCSGCE